MKFTVEFMRYFEEFGCNDFDTVEFDNLKDAWSHYNSIKDTYTNVRLWRGELGTPEFCQIA